MTSRLALLDFAGNRAETSFDSWPVHLLERAVLVERAISSDLPIALDDYVRQLADLVGEAAPTHVVAYCAASGIGVALASELRRRRVAQPTLVLVDPVRRTSHDVVGEFHDIVGRLSATVATQSRVTASQLGADPAAALARMADVLAEGVRAAMDPADAHPAGTVDADGSAARDALTGELVSRYHRWLCFLSLAAQVTWSAPDGRVLEFLSGDRPPPTWDERCEPERTHVGDDPRGALVHSDVVAAISALVDEGGPC